MRQHHQWPGSVPARRRLFHILSVMGQHAAGADVVHAREIENPAYVRALVAKHAYSQGFQMGNPRVRPGIVFVVAGDEKNPVLSL